MLLTSVSLAVLFLLHCTNLLTLGFEAENMILYTLTVEEGKSTQFKCDSAANPPFYYYKYATKTNPPILIENTEDQFPWQVYAVDAFDSANIRTMPTFLARSDYPFNVSSISVEFNNVLVCCQGECQGYQRSNQSETDWIGNDQNATVPSIMNCYRVNVQFSPQIVQLKNFGQWITPLHPTSGQEVVISCPLEGNPLASYWWYFKALDHNDTVLIQPGNNFNIRLLNKNRTLYFERFEEHHNGNYICNAENFLGKMMNITSPEMKVNKCTAYDPSKPSVTINGSHNLVAYVGDDLHIECIVASLPNTFNTLIRWYKNDTVIFYSSPASRVYYSASDYDEIYCRRIVSLYIRNLTFEDSDNYICRTSVSDYDAVVDVMSLTVTVPVTQPDYKSLIFKISIPVSVVIILLGITATLGIFYYLHLRQVKLQKALEQYRERPLPKKGDYQNEFFFAMTEDDEDKLEVDKLYVELKQSFSIYYQFDRQYLPGHTKVEMATEGIKNSRFIIILLSKAYLQQKDEIIRLELMYTMNRIEREFTKCAFIIPLEDNLFIPYKLKHITKFPKEDASRKLKELALSSGANFFPSEDTESVDTVELESLNDNDTLL